MIDPRSVATCPNLLVEVDSAHSTIAAILRMLRADQKRWLDMVHMQERIHQALDDLTSVEVKVATRAEARYPLLYPA